MPKFWQRIFIALTVVLAGLVWLAFASAFRAGDSLPGATLVDASGGIIGMTLRVAVGGLVTLALATAVGMTGNKLAGPFVFGASLCFVAAAGGASDGFLWRYETPAAMLGLIGEVLVWACLLAVVIVAVDWLHPLREKLPKAVVFDQFGGESRFLMIDRNSVLSLLVCTGVGLVGCNLALQSTDPGQLIGGVFLAFFLAGLLAGLVAPSKGLGLTMSTPLLTAIVAYAYVMLMYPTEQAVLVSWYSGRLPGMALALPMFYASAGVAGTAAGLGTSQAVDHARMQSRAAQEQAAEQ